MLCLKVSLGVPKMSDVIFVGFRKLSDAMFVGVPRFLRFFL